MVGRLLSPMRLHTQARKITAPTMPTTMSTPPTVTSPRSGAPASPFVRAVVRAVAVCVWSAAGPRASANWMGQSRAAASSAAEREW